MLNKKPSISVIALILANLTPLAGVLFAGWDAAAVVLVYWVENLVVGGYDILRWIFLKSKSPEEHRQKFFLIPFFCLHFGGFCAGHGLVLVMIFKIGGDPDTLFSENPWFGPLAFLQLLYNAAARLLSSRPAGMEWPVISLVISHGVSFVQNYIRKGEYRLLNTRSLMGYPYARVMLLHVAIIFGAAPTADLGSPVGLVAILVVLKTIIDLLLHNWSHRAISSRKSGKVERAPGSDSSGSPDVSGELE